MAQTATRSLYNWTAETALAMVERSWRPGTGPNADAVTKYHIAGEMVDLDCSLWHACHVAYTKAYNDGRLPTDTCQLCGGRNWPGAGDHNLCRVRTDRGVIPKRLDVVDGRHCDCAACARGMTPAQWRDALFAARDADTTPLARSFLGIERHGH